MELSILRIIRKIFLLVKMPADQEIPEIIWQLQHAEPYPHPVTEPIHLEQTHISYLLLTGKWA